MPEPTTLFVNLKMTDFSPEPPELVSASWMQRPLRTLLILLPRLPVTSAGDPDWAAADPDLLVELVTSSDMLTQIVHGGLASMGVLHACATGQLPRDTDRLSHTVALGLLQIELAEMLQYVHALAIACRVHMSDYTGSRKGNDHADSL